MPEPDTELCPFIPGHGTKPAHFSGRVSETSVIEDCLKRILEPTDDSGRVPATNSPIVIMGPRGVGKTRLLVNAKKRAEELKINVIPLFRQDIAGSPENLASRFGPAATLKEEAKKVDISARVGVPGASLGVTRRGDKSQKLLFEAIGDTLRDGPVLIAIDEAQRMPPDNFRDFCEIVQNYISEDYPLSLILAGTPSVSALLMGMGGTFMERADVLKINLLSEEESVESFAKGFEKAGMEVDGDGIGKMVDWSNNYPYFIQLVGRETWSAVNDRGDHAVTPDDVLEGIESAGMIRESFYNRRENELSSIDVHKQALQVIEILQRRSGGLVSEKLHDSLMEANDGMDKDGAKEVERKLMDLGFINEGPQFIEAGIPSLFDYMRAKANAAGDGKEKRRGWSFFQN